MLCCVGAILDDFQEAELLDKIILDDFQEGELLDKIESRVLFVVAGCKTLNSDPWIACIYTF